MRTLFILAVAMLVIAGASVARAQEQQENSEVGKTLRGTPLPGARVLSPTTIRVKEETREKQINRVETAGEKRELKQETREKTKDGVLEKRETAREKLITEKKETREAKELQKREEKDKELAERQKEREAKKIERVKAYFEKITTRLEAAVERLTKLAERLESRAQKLATEKGVDVSKTRELLGVAKTKIADAKTTIGQIRTEVVAMFAGETEPRIAFEKAKGLLETAKESVKAAHRALVLAIASLKASAGLAPSEAEGLRDDVRKSEKTENAETNE